MGPSIILLFVLVACGTDPAAPPKIQSDQEYSATLATIKKLSENCIQKALADQDLSDQQRADLKDAVRLAKGIVAYKPENGAAHVLVAQCQFALGEYEASADNLRQAIPSLKSVRSGPNDLGDVAAIQVEADALALRARCFEKLKAYEQARLEAIEALQLIPKNPEYACLVASTDIQIGSPEAISEAKKLIQAVLKADPNHARARQLGKLVFGSAKQTK